MGLAGVGGEERQSPGTSMGYKEKELGGAAANTLGFASPPLFLI